MLQFRNFYLYYHYFYVNMYLVREFSYNKKREPLVLMS